MHTFYGFKQSQSQDFDSKGNRVPLTWVKVEPVTVVSQKTNSVQIAFGTRKHPNKSLQGLFKNLTDKLSPRYLRETKFDKSDQLDQFPIGHKIQIPDVFDAGDKVKVTGTSIGKGFAGVMKRHGFHGGPKTHGQSLRPRHPGSIGQTTTPGRVYRGKKMAGHLGNAQVTIRNLEIFAVKPEENLLAIKGLVPGHKGSLLRITKLV